MDIKQILNKVLEKQDLNEEELEALKNYNPDSIAAASRRSAESKVDELKRKMEELNAEKERLSLEKEQLNTEKMSETEKLSLELKKLGEEVQQLNESKEQAEQRAKAMERSKTLEQIRKQNNIEFMPNVDTEVLETIFEKNFGDLEELNDEEEIKARVEKFKTKNAGIIVDKNGHGSGIKPSPADVKAESIDKMSPEERAKDLKSKKLL